MNEDEDRSNGKKWVWQRGGARVHHVYLTWPFAILSISKDALELRVLFWRWRMPSSEIRRIRRISGITTPGIEIEHACDAVPRSPVFWSLDMRALQDALENAGYEIAGPAE